MANAPTAAGEVAAVAAPIDKRFVDRYLAEKVIHIVIGLGRFA